MFDEYKQFAGETHLLQPQPQPQLHILSERRPDDPPVLKGGYLGEHDQTSHLLFLQQDELERMGGGDGGIGEAADSKMTGSEFEDDDQTPLVPADTPR